MNTKLLIQFTAVAHAGSITEAAKRLHIAQPALSHAINTLEEDVGAKLFDRHRRGVRLTDSGLVLLEHAQTILRQLEYARAAVLETEEKPSGPVVLALPASVSHVLSKPICEAVLADLPQVVLSLDEGLTGNLTRVLRSGRIDLMIDFDVERNDEFVAEPLLREDLYLFGQDIGPGDTIQLSRAAEFPLYLPSPQHAMGRAIARYERQCGLRFNRVPINLGVQPMLALVAAGQGQSISPWSLIYDRVGQAGIQSRRIVEPSMSRTAYLVFLQARVQTPATKAVASIIRRAVAQVHAQDQWRGELLT